MKYKQPRLWFELILPDPFPTMIIITPRAPIDDIQTNSLRSASNHIKLGGIGELNTNGIILKKVSVSFIVHIGLGICSFTVDTF